MTLPARMSNEVALTLACLPDASYYCDPVKYRGVPYPVSSTTTIRPIPERIVDHALSLYGVFIATEPSHLLKISNA